MKTDREKYIERYHGKSGTAAHRSWAAMVQRCTNPNRANYEFYGGRGISVCKKWQTFMGFFEDMGNPPHDDYQLDRIDNDGNYCKSNCKWSSRKEQCRNRRTSVLITYNGETKTLAEWSEITALDARLISSRINKQGWPVQLALFLPPKKGRNQTFSHLLGES